MSEQKEQRISLWDILNVVMSWTRDKSCSLDALDICSLLCSCKEASQCIQWDAVRAIYGQSCVQNIFWRYRIQDCAQCGRPDRGPMAWPQHGPDRCMHCRGIIVTRDACHNYHLQYGDFDHLPWIPVRVLRGQGKQTTLFEWSTAVDHRAVVSVAMIKHGGPKGLREVMKAKRRHLKGHKKREDDVSSMVEKLDLSESQKLKWSCQPLPRPALQYIRGNASVEAAHEAVQKMAEYDACLATMSEEHKSLAKRSDFRHFYTATNLFKQKGYASFEQTVDQLAAWSRLSLYPPRNHDQALYDLLSVIEPVESCQFEHLVETFTESQSRYSLTLPELPIRLKPHSDRALRKKALNTGLGKLGLSLRSDSRLCRSYIDGKDPDLPLREVCEVMLEMDWLIKNTNYTKQFAALSELDNEKAIKDHRSISLTAKRNALLPWRHKISEFPENLKRRLVYYLPA